MLIVLRIIGVFNAAIWLGAGIFFLLGVAPGVFSESMKQVFAQRDNYYLGIIAQNLIERYFALNLICCIIALGHFFAEMIYAGKPFRRFTFALLVGLLSLGLLGGHVFSPRIKAAHQAKYQGKPEARPAATQQLARLHTVSRTGFFISLIALIIYTWQVTNPSDHMRFVSASKFRG